MVSVAVAALLAFTSSPEAATSSRPAALDLRCYGLMAELASDEDPRIRAAGTTGAQYFLGRIDAAAPGFDPDAHPVPSFSGSEREQLVARCGAMMGAGGRDFRALGERLIRPRDTV